MYPLPPAFKDFQDKLPTYEDVMQELHLLTFRDEEITYTHTDGDSVSEVAQVATILMHIHFYREKPLEPVYYNYTITINENIFALDSDGVYPDVRKFFLWFDIIRDRFLMFGAIPYVLALVKYHNQLLSEHEEWKKGIRSSNVK